MSTKYDALRKMDGYGNGLGLITAHDAGCVA